MNKLLTRLLFAALLLAAAACAQTHTEQDETPPAAGSKESNMPETVQRYGDVEFIVSGKATHFSVRGEVLHFRLYVTSVRFCQVVTSRQKFIYKPKPGEQIILQVLGRPLDPDYYGPLPDLRARHITVISGPEQ